MTQPAQSSGHEYVECGDKICTCGRLWDPDWAMTSEEAWKRHVASVAQAAQPPATSSFGEPFCSCEKPTPMSVKRCYNCYLPIGQSTPAQPQEVPAEQRAICLISGLPMEECQKLYPDFHADKHMLPHVTAQPASAAQPRSEYDECHSDSKFCETCGICHIDPVKEKCPLAAQPPAEELEAQLKNIPLQRDILATFIRARERALLEKMEGLATDWEATKVENRKMDDDWFDGCATGYGQSAIELRALIAEQREK